MKNRPEFDYAIVSRDTLREGETNVYPYAGISKEGILSSSNRLLEGGGKGGGKLRNVAARRIRRKGEGSTVPFRTNEAKGKDFSSYSGGRTCYNGRVLGDGHGGRIGKAKLQHPAIRPGREKKKAAARSIHGRNKV